MSEDVVAGNFGLGGGPVLSIMQIQECGRWGCLGVYGSLWSFDQRGKGMLVGRDWGCKRNLGRALGWWIFHCKGECLLGAGALTTSPGLDWIEGGGLRRGPSPFRFENMWLKVEGFLDLIRNWWRGIEVRGTASYRLAAKMKKSNIN
ncbi:hypothetical protein CK203_043085 [Vitis vinifera]|uniref:Uncharacterized protein n=1 Tax=Vitis vinifera TaxID=29760 RepID=A0A438GXE6_VITVI|nr:hypothetical protein CK203_043085 [Vitis vinifera]